MKLRVNKLGVEHNRALAQKQQQAIQMLIEKGWNSLQAEIFITATFHMAYSGAVADVSNVVAERSPKEIQQIIDTFVKEDVKTHHKMMEKNMLLETLKENEKNN